jgi:hypothetical protein
MVKKLDLFQHLPPLRPRRQKCALVGFQYNEIAAAALDLDAVLFLAEDFSVEGLPKAKHLFPIKRDKFYMALLEEKKRYPQTWAKIVDYQFE